MKIKNLSWYVTIVVVVAALVGVIFSINYFEKKIALATNEAKNKSSQHEPSINTRNIKLVELNKTPPGLRCFLALNAFGYAQGMSCIPSKVSSTE